MFLNDRINVSDLSFLFKIISGQISFATQLLQLVYFYAELYARTFTMNHARYGYNFVTSNLTTAPVSQLIEW